MFKKSRLGNSSISFLIMYGLGKIITLPLFGILLFVCVGFVVCFDMVLFWLESVW